MALPSEPKEKKEQKLPKAPLPSWGSRVPEGVSHDSKDVELVKTYLSNRLAKALHGIHAKIVYSLDLNDRPQFSILLLNPNEDMKAFIDFRRDLNKIFKDGVELVSQGPAPRRRKNHEPQEDVFIVAGEVYKGPTLSGDPHKDTQVLFTIAGTAASLLIDIKAKDPNNLPRSAPHK